MGHTEPANSFLEIHENQLRSSGVPRHFWPTLRAKIQAQTYDAGRAFQLLRIDYDGQKQPHEPSFGLRTTLDVDKADPSHIYLIDHAWTFRINTARNQLNQNNDLLIRMAGMLGLESCGDVELVDRVYEEMWKLCGTYSIANADNVEDRLPFWYIMDEIGSAVMHNDSCNCRIVPFIDSVTQIAYSLLFPIEDIGEGQFVCRDFAEAIQDDNEKSAVLLPWVPRSFVGFSVDPPIPGADYYLSGHIEESLPVLVDNFHKTGDKLRVFTEYDLIREYLTDDRFELVDCEDGADILWLTRHFKDYRELSKSHTFINQFPFEYVVTVKDLLALTCRRSAQPDIHPRTYNLKTELVNFVSYFQTRQQEGDCNNYWIIKPYNLARSLDTYITNNLNLIMQLHLTGPKISQKYITDPVLFHRPDCGSVKFDIRYVVLLKSVNPLRAFVYRHFFLRFANKPFDLSDFDVYEKHFTVMNYEEGVQLKHMLCSEFKDKWALQYPDFPWDSVEKSILGALAEVLRCASKEAPPCGLAQSPRSRALYAADLMLEWTDRKTEIRPKILEMNWTPDCQRACQYYPEFYNDIFNLLFTEDERSLESFTEL